MENGTRLLAETLMELGKINNDLQSRVNGVEWKIETSQSALKQEEEKFNKYRAGAKVESDDLRKQLQLAYDSQKLDFNKHVEKEDKLIAKVEKLEKEVVELHSNIKYKSERITILEVGITNAMKSIGDRKVLRKLKELLK